MTSSHRDLKVWQKAVELSVALYKLTEKFPKQEIFGLTSQIRRAGVSTASNIAEGFGRGATGDYKRFLGMARGSNLEAQTQLVIARKLEFGDPCDLDIVRRYFGRIKQNARNYDEALLT
jgi:four helix bundle protein